MDRRLEPVDIGLVSPSDVPDERKIVGDVVGELNDERNDVAIRLRRWETHARSSLHADGPQGAIDEQLDFASLDLVLGIFWQRFGTPTKDAESGTEHELRLAWTAWRAEGRPQVMVFFCQRPTRPRLEDVAQLERVLRFQREMPEEQLWWPYSELAEFERLARRQLRAAVDQIIKERSEQRAAAEAATPPRLRIGECDARFTGAPEPGVALDAPVRSRVIIGSGWDADLQLVGPAARGVSARHLALLPTRAGWSFRDLQTTNGTFEADLETRAWRRVPSDIAIPVDDAVELCLGPDLPLRIEAPPLRRSSGQTPRSNQHPLAHRRVAPGRLESVAAALVAPRRLRPGSSAVSPVAEICRRLDAPEADVDEALNHLRELPSVRPFVRNPDVRALADALELAYPYLVSAAITDRQY